MTKEISQLDQVLIDTIQKATTITGEAIDGAKKVTGQAIDFASAQIQFLSKWNAGNYDPLWCNCTSMPQWNNETIEFRIKPESKQIKGYVNIYLYDGKYPSYGRVIYESKGYAEEQGVSSKAYLKTVEISETIEV